MTLSQRKQEERINRQERIINAAVEVFNAKGVEGVTMDEIAQSSGFGKATLYYYFSSKEDVLQAILETGWKKLLECIQSSEHSDLTPKRKLIDLLKNLSQAVQGNKALYTFLFKAPVSFPSIKDEDWKKHQRSLYSTIAGILEEGVTKGDFVDLPSEFLMKTLGGIFHGLLFMGTEGSEVTDHDLELLISKILEPQNEEHE